MSAPRWLAAEELDWSSVVRTGDRVSWPQACGEPTTLTDSFFTQLGHRGDLECFVGIPATRTWEDDRIGQVRMRSYTGSGVNRQLIEAGRMGLVRVDYSRLPELLSTGDLSVDVMLLLVPPPDDQGRFNLGPVADYHCAAIHTARTVVVEVSDSVPWVAGAPTLAPDRIDIAVRSRTAPPSMRWAVPDTAGQEVARRAAEWVADGATLQIGVGALPSAVLAHLGGRRDLAVHSGMLPDAIEPLIAAGVVTGRHNPVDPGAFVAGAIMGGPALMKWAGADSRLRVKPTGYTHRHDILSAQHRLVAVNAALQVDLRGNVNAERVGGRYVGALGGAADFARGAQRSEGGLVLALLVSRRRGVSNVVEDLGEDVTLGRELVDVIVTEHGSADLRGCSAEEVRRRVSAIAGPPEA